MFLLKLKPILHLRLRPSAGSSDRWGSAVPAPLCICYHPPSFFQKTPKLCLSSHEISQWVLILTSVRRLTSGLQWRCWLLVPCDSCQHSAILSLSDLQVQLDGPSNPLACGSSLSPLVILPFTLPQHLFFWEVMLLSWNRVSSKMSVWRTLQLFCCLSCSSPLVPDFSLFSLTWIFNPRCYHLYVLHPSLPASCLPLLWDLSLNSMVNHFNHFLARNSQPFSVGQTAWGNHWWKTPSRPGSMTANDCSKTYNYTDGSPPLHWWSITPRGPLKLPCNHIIFSRFIFFPTIQMDIFHFPTFLRPLIFSSHSHLADNTKEGE